MRINVGCVPNEILEGYKTIEIQECISCMGIRGAFSRPVEYYIVAWNNGSIWKIDKIDKMN